MLPVSAPPIRSFFLSLQKNHRALLSQNRCGRFKFLPRNQRSTTKFPSISQKCGTGIFLIHFEPKHNPTTPSDGVVELVFFLSEPNAPLWKPSTDTYLIIQNI